MAELGLNAYRFSVSWPRVLPNGDGKANPGGLDFYSRLVDALLARGITPFITLYHWDLPQALQERGGWAKRDIAGWFGEYAALLGKTLGDRVKHWITFNEPFAFIVAGHVSASAPGCALRQCSHHMNWHGAACALRAARRGAIASRRYRCRPIPRPTAKPTTSRRVASTASSTAGTGSRRSAASTRTTSASASARWRRAASPATRRA
jgi:beta-glucosidase